MRVEGPFTRLINLPIPIGGMQYQTSNKSTLDRNRKARLVCPICGIDFERNFKDVKKVKNSYCGRGCASKAKEKKINCKCVVCGKDFKMIPSKAPRYKTCSQECCGKHRSVLAKKGVLFPNGTPIRTRADGNRKITIAQVAEILESNATAKELAAVYGVSDTCIRTIIKREALTLVGEV